MRCADQVREVEPLRPFEHGTQVEREDHERHRERQPAERLLGLHPQLRGNPEQICNHPRRHRCEQRTAHHAQRRLPCRGKARDLLGAPRVLPRQRLSHELRGGAPQSQVQQAEVADDRPHQRQEAEAGIPQRPGQDRNRHQADCERQRLTEDVV